MATRHLLSQDFPPPPVPTERNYHFFFPSLHLAWWADAIPITFFTALPHLIAMPTERWRILFISFPTITFPTRLLRTRQCTTVCNGFKVFHSKNDVHGADTLPHYMQGELEMPLSHNIVTGTTIFRNETLCEDRKLQANFFLRIGPVRKKTCKLFQMSLMQNCLDWRNRTTLKPLLFRKTAYSDYHWSHTGAVSIMRLTIYDEPSLQKSGRTN